MTVKRAVAVCSVIALLSFAMAVISVRVDPLWPLMPIALSDWLMDLFNVESQEQASDIEFVAVWLLCFVSLAAITAMGLAVRRRNAPALG